MPEVASTDDEVRTRVRLERGHELRDLGRVVLAVGVEREDGVVALGDGAFEAQAQRGALALVRALFDDRRPGDACLFRRVVRRAVVDNEDRAVAQCRLDDRPDPRTLVVARDQGDDAGASTGEGRAMNVRSATSPDRADVEADADQEDG